MRATMLWLAALGCVAPLEPIKAHEHLQNQTRIDGREERQIERRREPEGSWDGDEPHPEIAALIKRAGECIEFRVRAPNGNGGAETTRIEKCD